MANPEAYLISGADLRVVERLLHAHNRFRKNTDLRPLSSPPDHEEMSSPEVYAAKTPTAGIPALTVLASTGEGDQPGSAECTILRLLPDPTNPDEMETVGVFTKEVYNLSTKPILGDTWILIARDKYGTWFVSGTPPTGSGGFPVELTSEYEQDGRGYAWKRLLLQIDGDFIDHPSEETGQDAHSPDEDEHFKVGTRGWLFPSPDNPGELLEGSGSYDPEVKWVFIPVYRTRVTCEGQSLIYQESLNGGVDWENIEILGDCGDGTGTTSTGTAVDVGTGTTPENTPGDGPCVLAKLKTTDCLLASGPRNITTLFHNGQRWTSLTDDPLLFLDTEEGDVEFWFDGGQPHLSVDGLELMHCGDLCFTGGPLTGHTRPGTDTTEPCAGEVFTVCVECVTCPEYYYCVATSGVCLGTGSSAATVKEVMLLTPAEAESLGSAVCSGPYNTEAEAQEACDLNGASCATAVPLPSDTQSGAVFAPAGAAPPNAVEFEVWFKLDGIQPVDDYYVVIEHDMPSDDLGQIDGILWWFPAEDCTSGGGLVDICACTYSSPLQCCNDTTAGSPPPSPGYIYFQALVRNEGPAWSFTVTMGRGTAVC